MVRNRRVFRPELGDALESRDLPSSLAKIVPAQVMSTPRPSTRQLNLALRQIHAAYLQYYHELRSAIRDGQAAIANGDRSPTAPPLGFRNFSQIKLEFLQHQLRNAVVGLPYGVRELYPQVEELAQAYQDDLVTLPTLAAVDQAVNPSSLRALYQETRSVVISFYHA